MDIEIAAYCARIGVSGPLPPRQLADFTPGCEHHQHSPESHFTRQRVCSLATKTGRITLSDRHA